MRGVNRLPLNLGRLLAGCAAGAGLLLAALLLATLTSVPVASEPQQIARALPVAAQARLWTGPDGRALPFASDEATMEFLRRAKVKDVKTISVGITGPQKVLLELEGVRAHAHFNYVDVDKQVATFSGGKREVGFRDSHHFQSAAYELAKLLGLDNVPPGVERRVQGQVGTLTIWIENSFTEKDRLKNKLAPPKPQDWIRQKQNMRVFDNLIHNIDRNQGNMLYDANWKLWMIDHTRAFRRKDDLLDPPEIELCGRNLWRSLRDLNEAEVRVRLQPYLRGIEIDALLKRRAKLIALIERQIQKAGEIATIFADEK